MTEYRVRWEIDVYAETGVEAAQKARAAQIRPGTHAVVFDVDSGNPSGPERVDLLELLDDGKIVSFSDEDLPMPRLSSRDLAAILHGLRIIQEVRVGEKGGCLHAENTGQVDDPDNVTSCDHFGDAPSLTVDEIDALCERLNCGTPAEPPRVVIVCEGGMVTDILSTLPVQAAVIDYDTDGAEAVDLKQIPQKPDGVTEDGLGGERGVDLDPARAMELWNAVTGDPVAALEAQHDPTNCSICEDQGIPQTPSQPFLCKGCGREESECSANPCPGVIADREEGSK